MRLTSVDGAIVAWPVGVGRGRPGHVLRVDIDLEGVARLRFADGSPVRAASAVTPFGNGFLVAQDDATHAAWFRDGAVSGVRLLPAVDGHEVFDEASGTKHLKPDIEAACPVTVDDVTAALLLGSGSSPARMRSVLLQPEGGSPRGVVADLAPLYVAVADALGVEADVLNMEGACVIGDRLRWYHRGLPSAGFPSGSVDLDLAGLVAAVHGEADPATLQVANPRRYELGEVDGVGLAITDAVVLPGGSVLVSAAAEDSPNVRDDGPVVGSALVRLDGHAVEEVTTLPDVDGNVSKVEGLMILGADESQAQLLAVVDVDDPNAPSLAMRLSIRF